MGASLPAGALWAPAVKPGEIRLLRDRATGLAYPVEVVAIVPRPFHHGEFNAMVRVPGSEKTAKIRIESLERAEK